MLNMVFKYHVLGLVSALCSVMLVGQAYAVEDNDTLVVAVENDIRSTNPGVKRDRTTDVVLHHVAESLVAYNADLEVVPMLASSIELEADGLSYIFHLRDDVRFHNGTAMTAEHVKWSWERMLAPETGWRCRRWYDGTGKASVKITSITVLSPLTVEFRLEKPSATFLHRMANLQCISAILHPNSVKPDGEWGSPIATGPYQVNSWQRGEYILLKRFEDYSLSGLPMNGLSGAKHALMQYLKFTIIPESSVAKAALAAGDVDIVMQLPMTVFPEVKNVEAVKVWVQPVLDWNVLLLQTQDPILSDVRVRQAIAYAIDRAALADYATYGFSQPNSSAVPVENPFFTPKHKNWYPYDQAKARALLGEAGYTGQLLKIQTNKKQIHLYDNAIIMHAMLRDAGFNVELEVVDWATQLGNYLAGTFQLSSFDYSARTEPFMNYQVFMGSKAGNPAVQWDNAAAMQSLEQSETLYDSGLRSIHFEKLHDMMMMQVPIIGLYNKAIMYAQTKDVEGYESWVLGLQRFWGVTKKHVGAVSNGPITNGGEE